MILGYHIFNGNKWLADDEKTWTKDFTVSACFSDPKLAQDIGERETGNTSFYVMACLGWQ